MSNTTVDVVQNWQDYSHICSRGIWNTQYKSIIGGILGFSYETLVPTAATKIVNHVGLICPVATGPVNYSISELAGSLRLLMIITLLLILAISHSSMNKRTWDFFRLIGWYIVGSIGVLVFTALGTAQVSGFNRVLGFGVLTHNFAEWSLLWGIYNGTSTRTFNQWGIITGMAYAFFVLLAIAVMPLPYLYLFLMIQGVWCDWNLFVTFLYIAYTLPKFKKDDTLDFYWVGFVAAALHVMTVEVLFLGFSLVNPTYIGVATVLLAITFMLYIFVAVSDSPTYGTMFGAPPKTGKLIEQHETLVAVWNSYQGDTQLVNRGAGDSKEDEEDPAPAPVAPKPKAKGCCPNIFGTSASTYQGGLGYNRLKPGQFIHLPGSRSGVISEGLIKIFHWNATCQSPNQIMFWSTFGLAVVNAIIMWFTPCMQTTYPQFDCSKI